MSDGHENYRLTISTTFFAMRNDSGMPRENHGRTGMNGEMRPVPETGLWRDPA